MDDVGSEPSPREEHQVPTRCPVCAHDLRITRLQCRACGTALEGSFSLGRFQRLSREQLAFVEVFLKARGKIKDVEEEIGLSYPTVVARLNEVVQAMGFEGRPDGSTLPTSRRLQVLEDLAARRISTTEATARLRNL